MSVHEKDFLTLESATDAQHDRWHADRSGLVADALHLSGRLRMRVHGESMLPTLWPGDVVEIATCSPESVLSGEIVLALRDGRLFLHRVVSPCTPDGFQLRGDSRPGPDPRFSREALLGRLVSTNGNKKFGMLSRAMGIVFCHFGLARRLALKLHRHMTSRRKFQDSGNTGALATRV